MGLILTNKVRCNSCVGFAIVPSYETIGIMALLALMLFRSLQSAASVNEISCAITYMTEIISRPYAFFITSWMSISFAGMFAALLSASIVMKIYPEGWKLLFFVSGLLSFICFYYRRKVPESRMMVNDIKSYTSGKYRRQAYWKEVKKTLFAKPPLVQMSLEIGGVIFFYLVYVHCTVILKDSYNFTPTEIISNNTIVAFVDLLLGILLASLVSKYHPVKILKCRFFLALIMMLLTPWLLNLITSPYQILLLQCALIFFSMGKVPAQSLVVLLYPILCRVSMRSFIYSLSRVIASFIGGLILFLSVYMTQIKSWSILAFIFAGCFYWALQFLKNKESERYDTVKYREAMKNSYEWGTEVFKNQP